MRVVRAAAGRRGESVNEEGDDADDGEAPRRRRVLRGGAEDVRALAGVVQLRLLRAAGDEPCDGVGSGVRRPARTRDEAGDGARRVLPRREGDGRRGRERRERLRLLSARPHCGREAAGDDGRRALVRGGAPRRDHQRPQRRRRRAARRARARAGGSGGRHARPGAGGLVSRPGRAAHAPRPEGVGDTVTLIDTRAKPIRAAEYVTVGVGPEGLALSPDGRWLAVALQNGTNRPKDHAMRSERGRLLLFSLRGTRATQVARAATGRNTQGVAFTTDGKYVVVQNYVEQERAMYRMTPTALEDTGVRIKVKDTRRRSASRRSSAERMRDQGSLQSRQLPQRAQTILQWISSIRSPQRSQKWTRASM